MKKITVILLSFLLLVSFIGCAKTPGTQNVAADKTLSEIVAEITKDTDSPDMTADVELDDTNFGMYAFIEPPDGATAVANEALINAIAHSVVLIRLESADSAAEVAADIEANANPRKWICVEAEKTVVKHRGDLVLLVMSTSTTADAIADNFDKLS